MWMHLEMDSLIKSELFSNVFFLLFRPLMKNRRWLGWMLVKEENDFPPNWCNSGFKGGCCPECCKICHMLCWWGFFMTTSIMLKRSWKLAVMPWSVFMDYKTNCKCIICKSEMLNACSVLFSRNWVWVWNWVIHTHAHILSHTYASVKCYNISVNISALHLPNFQLIRSDRDAESMRKLHSGGMCFYINERWCTYVTVLKKMCCSRNALHQLQGPSTRHRRFVCLFPWVSTFLHKRTWAQLYWNLLFWSQTQNKNTQTSANLSCKLPKYRQHITCPNRDSNIGSLLNSDKRCISLCPTVQL